MSKDGKILSLDVLGWLCTYLDGQQILPEAKLKRVWGLYSYQAKHLLEF